MSKLTVSRVRASHPATAMVVRVDRTNVLGNPFKMDNESMRDTVCDKYAVWLQERIKAKDNAVIGELKYIASLLYNGHDVIITCHCAPKRCHAHEIKRVIDRAIARVQLNK